MTERDQEGRKQTHGGVQSIFTTERARNRNALPALGLLAVGGGVTIWIWALRNFDTSNGIDISQSVASSALTLASLGMLIVLTGTGLCAYSFAARKARMGRRTMGLSVRSNESAFGLTNELSSRDTSTRQSLDSTWNLRSTHRVSKTFLVAVVQSSVFIASYVSLVAEYETNLRIQSWVQTNFPLARGLLNYYVVLLLTGLLGVLLIQFFPRKHFSE